MDFLEAVEEQLVAATERGVGRRRWRWPWLMRLRLPLRAPTIGIAAGVGTALAASALAATLTLPASKPRVHSAAAGANGVRSYTTAGAVPVGFEPHSFTAVSELDWWLLGTAPCGGHECTAIVRTTDGGPLFTRIPAPPTTGVANVRFANARDGYAFGPQLWTTRDGGATWHRASPRGSVTQLAASGHYVFALANIGGRSALLRSPVGTDAWTLLPTPGGAPFSLWVQGNAVLVQTQSRSAQHLAISDDGGAHFVRLTGVKGAGDCGYDAVSSPFAIWALCSTGMAPDDILLSTDSGNTFRAAAGVPDGPIDAFAAATATVAVASGQGPLFRTSNGGASWTSVAAPSAGWSYIGFTDATHGVAIGNFGSGGHPQSRLYYTTDGGASYHLVPIGP
jgi:photosystem II stability/assembly factor-like uncharacterized protein